MKKKAARTMAGILTLSMAAALTACGGSGSETAKKDGAAENSGPITGQTLSVMLSEEPGEQDPLGNALNHWAEESGNTIKKIIISHDDMRSKFPAMAKNKDLPDIVSTTFLHQIYPDEFVNMEDVVDLSKFNQSALNIVGKSYSSDAITGIIEQYTTTCMFYNKDAFAAAGIEAPTVENPWTWDQLYENAAILQEKAGV